MMDIIGNCLALSVASCRQVRTGRFSRGEKRGSPFCTRLQQQQRLFARLLSFFFCSSAEVGPVKLNRIAGSALICMRVKLSLGLRAFNLYYIYAFMSCGIFFIYTLSWMIEIKKFCTLRDREGFNEKEYIPDGNYIFVYIG